MFDTTSIPRLLEFQSRPGTGPGPAMAGRFDMNPARRGERGSSLKWLQHENHGILNASAFFHRASTEISITRFPEPERGMGLSVKRAARIRAFA